MGTTLGGTFEAGILTGRVPRGTVLDGDLCSSGSFRRRHITFYKDEARPKSLLEIQQLNKVEFPYANFHILDTAGNLIGKLRKNVLFDYIRRRWHVTNANGLQLCTRQRGFDNPVSAAAEPAFLSSSSSAQTSFSFAGRK